MKSLVTLNAELDALKTRAAAMLDTCKVEQRKLNDDETSAFNSLAEEIKAKEQEIRDAEANQIKINNTKNEVRQMEKKNFSLLGAIRGVINNNIDDTTQAVINAGREEMRAAALNSQADIVIPVAHRAINVGTSDKTVPVEVANIFDEIRARSVFAAAGATYMTGLQGDVKVPVLGSSTVGWEGEIGTPNAGTGSIGGVVMQPKRLTAYMDISKQLLLQSSPDVEAALQANLVRAVQDKLEATVFGAAAGDATKPAGMFNGKTISAATTTFAQLAALEATVDGKDNGEYKYILSPGAKAVFRGMTMNNGTKNVASNYILAGGEVDGVPALTTANMHADHFVVGYWNRLVVAQFGGIEVTVDPYSRAANGEIRLVINAYVDAKVADANAFAYGKVQ